MASVIVAKLADLILGQTLKALAGRTSTLFDDRLIELLHRPVIQTVVFFGVLVALAFQPVLQPLAPMLCVGARREGAPRPPPG